MPHVTLARTLADLVPAEHVRVLLFDWDGTLFDNHHVNYVALSHGLQVHGIAITEDWFQRNSGFSATRIVAEAVAASGSAALVEDVLRERDAYVNARLDQIPRVAPLHELLHHPGDRKVGIVTGSNLSNIEGLLLLHRLDDRLDVLVTRDEVLHGKPNPESYLVAMNRLGITDGGEVLVYEDSDQGIEAALRAGADVVDVRGLRSSQG